MEVENNQKATIDSNQMNLDVESKEHDVQESQANEIQNIPETTDLIEKQDLEDQPQINDEENLEVIDKVNEIQVTDKNEEVKMNIDEVN